MMLQFFENISKILMYRFIIFNVHKVIYDTIIRIQISKFSNSVGSNISDSNSFNTNLMIKHTRRSNLIN